MQVCDTAARLVSCPQRRTQSGNWTNPKKQSNAQDRYDRHYQNGTIDFFESAALRPTETYRPQVKRFK
jgi:hypothetical protein